MMHEKSKYLLILIMQVLISLNTIAQSHIKELQIGDYVPSEMVIGKFINYKKKTAKFSDFKGKLLIIDFWSTSCATCVSSLPKMDSLQKLFGDKISIVPSTTEGADKIAKYLESKPWNLPSIVEDSLFYIKDPKTGKEKISGKALWGLFPHHANPYEVWIDPTGKVLATTRHEEVNANNISQYISTGKLNIKIDSGDISKTINEEKDLLIDGNGGLQTDYVMRSVFTNELDLGIRTSAFFPKAYDPVNGKLMWKSIMDLNVPSSMLYRQVFIMNRYDNPFITRLILENEDETVVLANCESSSEAYKKLESFTGNKNYCYNLTVPKPGVIDTVFYRQYMLNDLNRYFDYSVKIEKRKMPSWIIVRKGNSNEFLAAKNDTVAFDYIFDHKIDKNYLEEVRNLPIEYLFKYVMGGYTMAPAVFNETGYVDEKINLKNLHLRHGYNSPEDAYYKPLNLEEWRAAFQRNGLDIKVEDREVEVMVFKKKETPSK